MGSSGVDDTQLSPGSQWLKRRGWKMEAIEENGGSGLRKNCSTMANREGVTGREDLNLWPLGYERGTTRKTLMPIASLSDAVWWSAQGTSGQTADWLLQHPDGHMATVHSTGIMGDGVWWFTVIKWHPYTPLAIKFPRDATEYSLNLWEKNLPLFEVVTAEQREAPRRLQPASAPSSTLAPLPKLGVRPPGQGLSRNASVHPNQLSDDV